MTPGSIHIAMDITIHKKAEEGLYQYEQIVSSSTDMMALLDKRFTYIAANQAYMNAFGKTSDEIIGHTVSQVFGENFFETVIKSNASRCLAGEEINYHAWFEFPSTGRKYMDFIYKPCTDVDNNVKGFVVIARDITEKKKMEELLKSSDDYLQKLNDSLGDVIFTVKFPERVIEYANRAVERVFGYKPDECIGKETKMFYSEVEEYYDLGRLLKNAIKEGKNELRVEKLFKRKNGEIFPCEITTTFLKENEKIVQVISILHDITKRKEAENDLLESLSLTQAVLESTIDGILVVNRNGKITSSSKRFQEMWGIPDDVLVEMDDDKAIEFVLNQLQDPDVFLSKVRELYNKPDETSFDTLEFIDGRIIERYSQPQRIGNEVVGRVWSFRDVTERKRVEEELKRYRDNLEYEVETRTKELNFQKYALDEHAIVSATDARGNITYANDRFCNISGYTRDELMGQNHRMIKSGEHSPEFFSDMWHIISSGKTWHGEVKNKKKKGGYYWVKATLVPFMDESGKPYQYISIRTEITDHKKAEKELKKYASEMEQLAENRAQQLIHADRMATLGTLSAGIAHEINNPVGFISNNLQIFEKLWDQTIRAYLEKAKGKNEDKKLTFAMDEIPTMVEAMKEGTRRIANIVHNLGKFSRKTIPVFEPSNICEVIEAAVKLSRLDLTVKHKVKIQLDLPDDIPNIKISRQEIEQVLINLITNSGHAMEYITGRKELILKIAASHVSNNIVIEITDNGHGMDEKILSSIFTPFFTTKEVGKGTGLGLSICRGIIEQHRGDITAKSTLGEGTTFIITLPIDP